MYSSELGGWLWQADATESYTQGPQTGKCCKLKVQHFYTILFSLLEYTVHAQGELQTVKVSFFL